MKVTRFNVGWITSSSAIWRQGDPADQMIRFPIPAYLIETEQERVLVDTGLNPAAVLDVECHYGSGALPRFDLEQRQGIDELLDVRELTKVVLTHLHFDHAGGLALLDQSVPVFVQRREWEAGREAAAIVRNFFLPRDYATIENRVVLLDGDHDLLDDGSIRLISTPGHTPGHQSVCVGDHLVIGGDVAHFATTLDDFRFPSFADDFEAQARSVRRLRKLRADGTTVIPGHDPDLLDPGPVAVS